MFTEPADIANRACQHVGARRIATMLDNSRQATEINFCYDKLRRAELRRSTWRFATRRAMLRAITATSKRFIPEAWDDATNYTAGQIVQDADGTYWICAVDTVGGTLGGFVAGQPPFWQQYFGPVWADVWAAQTTYPYQAGELVYTDGPVFFINTANNTTGADPADGLPWVEMTGDATDQTITLLAPVGPDMTILNPGGKPSSFKRNMFPLPNGYLRPLPPDPKVAATSTLVTSAALRYTDYQMEGDFIISAQDAPILLRFVADVSDVTIMDDMFCEMLASRIGYEICETLTQSNVKLQAIGAAYQKFGKEARSINWLETGSTEPQEEEYELTQGTQGVTESAQRPQGV